MEGRPTDRAPSEEGAQSLGAPPLALELRGITKAFGDNVANRDVDLAVGWGEIRGLVGENGAGKTTLMNIASGLYRPDAGEIFVGGEPAHFDSPLAAIHAGINMVHQDFALAEALTAAENIILGTGDGGQRLKRSMVEREIMELADRYGLPVEPWEPIWRMEPAQRQRVAILSALYRDCRILILDEPTSVLSPPQIEGLLSTVRRLAREGRSVIFITHKLREAVEVCDRITVMRHGTVVGTAERNEFDLRSLANMMVGRDLTQPADTRDTPSHAGSVVLRVSGVSVPGDRGQTSVDAVDLELRRGEILGLAGVDGNGQRELIEAIAGRREPSAGSIEVADDASGRPIAHIPSDPRHEAFAPTLSLLFNVGMRHYRDNDDPGRRRWLVDYGRLRAITEECINRFDVRGGDPDTRASVLSGGNLQKLVLAREMSLDSPIILATDPTAGLDIAAATYVRDTLRRARDDGAAILLSSADLDEVLQLSDRVAVIYNGRIVSVLPIDEVNRSEVGALMAGVGDRQAYTPAAGGAR